MPDGGARARAIAQLTRAVLTRLQAQKRAAAERAERESRPTASSSLWLGQRSNEFGEQRVIVVIAGRNDQAVTHSEDDDIAGGDRLSAVFRGYVRLEFPDNDFRVSRFMDYNADDFHSDRQLLQARHPFLELVASPCCRRFGNHEWVLDDEVFRVAFVDELRLPPFRDRAYEPLKYLGWTSCFGHVNLSRVNCGEQASKERSKDTKHLRRE